MPQHFPLPRGFQAALAAAALCTASWSGGAAAQTYDLTMAVITSPGDGYSILTASVPERVAKATDGKVKVTVSDSLVPPAQIATAVREGRVDMSAALHTYLAADEPRMGIFNLPGLINNIQEYRQVCDAFWCEDTRKIWKDKWNAIVLAEGAWCTQQLFSKDPIHKVEDFKGKRLRVHNPQTAEVVNALGGKPVAMPTTEIFPALERGVIDGLFISTCVGGSLEFWRIAKNVQNWSLGPINGWAILVNPDSWQKLPPEVQKQVQGAMDALQQEAFGNYDTFVGNAQQEMMKKGVTFWVAPEEERAKLMQQQYIGPSYEAWNKRAKQVGFDGPAYLDRVRTTLGKSASN
ncbi:ABC transporter, substrate-binding protein, family 7 [Bordetella bronchiseptica 99-R-0433]|uniref:TRAP transporter substrate-binding protein n=1 Tax=Bordetella bronchiseptica TaxID=518 RepID=UPI00045A2490|nr:TRAP transporter substrate-binding protein [Bordetella bronchiseptica]KCV61761.1 ABC transporter, substrate-binding protein, family 7 [Bordetella bronchiseptica 99-R-0433]